MDGKALFSSYRTYAEQQILKLSVQLAKSFSKYIFSKAKMTRFEKTSFKLMATEIVKIKLSDSVINQTSIFFRILGLSPTLKELSAQKKRLTYCHL